MPSTKTSAQEQISQQRAEIVEDIIKNMQKDGLQWADNLIYHLCPLNPTTGTLYKGVNKFRLAWAAHHFVFTDNRWCTFKQIKDNGWHIVKGSKGGIIPACAGNIVQKTCAIQPRRDHPRVCGEHQMFYFYYRLTRGIIPACAGNIDGL